MLFKLASILLITCAFQLHGKIDDSCLKQMDEVYVQDFGKKVNTQQKESMDNALQYQSQKLRLMTYNMLYNERPAEALLPEKHRWSARKPRVVDYVLSSKADIVGSQELQQDQLQEIGNDLAGTYDYYGTKIRENEGRADVNAIFYNPKRLELMSCKTVFYEGQEGGNGFTYCYFKDLTLEKNISVINTQLTWTDTERRLAQVTELNNFVASLTPNEPIILIGDFNLFPFLEHKKNFFFDGTYLEKLLTEKNLEDARTVSIFGHFGPLCSLTNSKTTLAPFVGPELTGFILDRIFVNNMVEVLVHGIDPAKVNGDFPSDHLPVIADMFFKQ